MSDYRRRLLLAFENGMLRPGDFGNCTITHDDDCGIFEGGACCCDPDVVLTVLDDDGQSRTLAIGPRGELLEVN